MKNLFSMLIIYLGSANILSASSLTCVAHAGKHVGLSHPNFKMTAEVSENVAKGEELVVLKKIRAVSAKQIEITSVSKDPAYKPRTKLNRNRFLFTLDATDDQFDGIIHGLIMPKVLTDQEITKEDTDGTIHFSARLMSSTDSYHDGIISYFPLACVLK